MQTILQVLQILFLLAATTACGVYVYNKRKELINSAPNPLKVYQDVYDALNYAIKTNQPYLRYDVNHMNTTDFSSLYFGFKKHHPSLPVNLRTDTEYKFAKNGGEYLEFNLTEYKGPRNKDLEMRLCMDARSEFQKGSSENVVPLFPSNNKRKVST